MISGTWSKESRLSELKTELAAVERKIQLSIAPENTQQEETIENNGTQMQEKSAVRLKA